MDLSAGNFEPGALSTLPGEELETAHGDLALPLPLVAQEPEPATESATSAAAEESASTGETPEGTADTDAAPAEDVAAEIMGRHRVAAGDSLWRVARRYGVTVDDLLRRNRGLGQERTLLRPGTELVIPTASTETTARPTEPARTGTTELSYTVTRGDNLSAIAKRFNTSVASLMLNNGLTDPERLAPGMVLVITTANRIVHVVNHGETLWELGKLYSVAVTELIAHNDLPTVALHAGQRILIPVSGANALRALALSRDLRSGKAFRRPLKARLADAFGWRIHPILNRRLFHCGVDLAAPAGTAINAIAPGVVTFAGWLKGYGKVVVIKHANGYSSRYAHCQSIQVKVGQTALAGQAIATVGSTGLATGPHLHLEVRKAGRPIDPKEVVLL
jgi:murein DD-endopeptidase MepM/ murein hydrolase activator NlpD